MVQKSLIDKVINEIKISEVTCSLDVIMILSAHENDSIRSIAFSTLNNLSMLCSQYQTVMMAVKRDI